ncbi:MAG TPA: cytochrome P450 [Acidimicrobiales bacterium]|nr:cytochrome P450 [Acidimicrobiales bacterium]
MESTGLSTSTGRSDVYYDPYDVAIVADPYPVYRRMREEAPLYYNEPLDFYAVSRWEDVESGLRDASTFISGRSAILELIRANVELPPGVFIFEDPPAHTIHRRLVSRVFSPRRVAELEGKVREFCVQCLDPLVGTDRFDIIANLGAQVPMKTISMLLGIPETDQEAFRDHADANLRTEAGKPMKVSSERLISGEVFADFVDWRTEHPSDDLMTDLVQAEFVDETGRTRRLERQELLTYLEVISGAGNETTNRLVGWTAKVLAEHPDQRRQVTEDRSLIPNTIEEILRYEPPAHHTARYVARDVEVLGHELREGSVMIFLLGSANRDDRRHPDGDLFDIHRDIGQILTFGQGIHLCLGAALARLEGRIVLDELLSRFPEWDVDLSEASLSPTSTVRGWERLPVVVR